MPISLFSYEIIASLYGEAFASTWFTPIGLSTKAG
ncbi:hypothetical protein SAMN06265370_10718 [Puniceibacterium sediminis]|uniref:Uncharacterized protein n=1 Tax=Puniceibacterium sediminis TaxID=1608407 RepID=A0A238WRM0_9RHOB|nr:hypothetical protein SAMN06265370_10718 [Puniceibacterium sediminis]